MARHSTFRGLFTFLGLYGALLGAFGAHLGLQPSPILSPAVGLKRSVIPLATCAAGRYECPESSGSALILIDCSLSEKGKLQCLYGDTASRTLGGSVGEVVAENGVNAVPTINVCNYDLASSTCYLLSSHNFLNSELSPSSFRVNWNQRLPRRFPLYAARAPSFELCIRFQVTLQEVLTNTTKFLSAHLTESTMKCSSSHTDGLPKLEARRVSALDILAKRGGSHNTTTTDSPNNATISDASSNATSTHPSFIPFLSRHQR